MIPPTPWVRSFCPLSLLYPSVSDFQFRYTPVTVGKGRAAWFSLRSASVLSFGRGDKAAESGDVDYEYHHIIKGLYATFSSWHIDHSTFNNLQHYRKFYILFPDFRKVYEFVHNLNWTHIRRLLSVTNPKARMWYLGNASEEMWSTFCIR